MAAANGVSTQVRVRMYRHGLGDCFLITFFTAQQPVHMLIDCGTLGEKTTGVKLADVADDIVKETGGHLHILVATHEHLDHVIGFGRQQAKFDHPFRVDNVWLAWTEDGDDPLAREIEKYTDDLLVSLTFAANALAAQAPSDPLNAGIREILSFAGDLPAVGSPFAAGGLKKTVDAAMTWVTERAANKDKFLQPGTVIEPAGLPGIRFYVLGPPRSKASINNLGSHGSPELYDLVRQTGNDISWCARFHAAKQDFVAFRASLDGAERPQFERQLPFDPRFRVEVDDEAKLRARFPAYFDATDEWRRIDTDWLNVSSDLALQLDNATNNTSLVLAIELIEDGRVLLFPADAQLGNWLSWHDLEFTVQTSGGATRKVTAADLLGRTVLYKVGHHSSHNATLRGKGLELMRRADLVAMIPLDRAVASSKWPTASWPAEHVYAALLERTCGRALCSDTDWPDATDRPDSVPKGKWDAARKDAEDAGVVVVAPLHIDFHLLK